MTLLAALLAAPRITPLAAPLAHTFLRLSHSLPCSLMSQDPNELVNKMAALARLNIAPEERERLASQFGSILEQFETLAALDVEGIEPMTGPLEPEDILREDEPRASLTQDEILANAPERIDGFYSVPKTIGGAE